MEGLTQDDPMSDVLGEERLLETDLPRSEKTPSCSLNHTSLFVPSSHEAVCALRSVCLLSA